jgi:hypothetical protein
MSFSWSGPSEKYNVLPTDWKLVIPAPTVLENKTLLVAGPVTSLTDPDAADTDGAVAVPVSGVFGYAADPKVKNA